jgi:hypothetical protein
MCGGSAQTTQQIQIPPEVLARYNSVNARAEDVASQGFQQYGTDPSAFVAPLSDTQQAGVANVNAAQNIAQPYFQGATSQLMGAQQNALPYFDQATQSLLGGQQAGVTGTQGAYQPMQQAAQAAQGLQSDALNQYRGAFNAAQPYNQAAAAGIAGAYAGAQPYQGVATGLAAAGTQAVNPGQLGGEQINQYMSPYLNSVVASTMANLRQQQGQEQSGLLGNQIAQGAFGGDRGRIAQANLARQQELATGQTVSGLMNQGYGQALSTAQQQQQLGLGAAQANRAALQQGANQMLGIGQQGYGQGLGSAQAMAGLGQQQYGQYSGLGQNLAQLGQQGFGQGAAQTAQQAALAQQMYGMGAGTAGQLAGLGQGIYGMGAGTSQALAGLGSQAQQNALGAAQAQLGAGTLQQQTEQAGKTALYNQFLQEKGFPYQQAQFLANIAMGTGALSGSTTQTTQPAPFFSDKHLKEAVEPIGKTFDGQNIVKFRYKNEPGTRIGLIAQDVEKHHPDAVGLAGGYKTVDYDKATEAAARKGKYAHGGLIPQSEGGAVTPYRAGQGYADGGSPSIVGPAELAALQEALQAQLAMYGGAGLNISGTPGATGVVPAANLPTANLVTAGPLPAALDSGLKNAADTGSKIVGLYKSGKEIYKDIRPEDVASTDTETGTHEDGDIDEITGLPTLRSRGGLAGHYAMGGMPGKEGYIPEEVYKPQDEKKEIETPGVPEQGKSDFSQAVDAAKTAAQIAAMFAANGGRINKDGGGGLFGNPAGDFDAETERKRAEDDFVRQRSLSQDTAAEPPAPRLITPSAPKAAMPQFETEPSSFVRPSAPSAEMPQFDVDYVDRKLLDKSRNAPGLAPPIPTMVRPQTANSSAPKYVNPIEQQLETARRYYQYANEGKRRDLSDADIGKFRRDAANLVANAFKTINTQYYTPPPSEQYAFRDPEGIATFSSQNAAQKGLGLSLRPSEKRAFQASAAETEKARLAALKAYGLSPSGELGPTPFTPYIMGPDANAQFINPQSRSDGSPAAPTSGSRTNRPVSARPNVARPAAPVVAASYSAKNPLGQRTDAEMEAIAAARAAGASDGMDYAGNPLPGLAPKIDEQGNPISSYTPASATGVVPQSQANVAQSATSPAAVNPPAQSTGVVPPAPQQKRPGFLERNLAPKGGYLDRLSEGDEDTVVSLLSGLGAMAGSSNRYGLGALAEGIGAGAGAYQKAKQNILNRQETGANIGQTLAGTGQVYAGAAQRDFYIEPTTGQLMVRLPGGRRVTRGQWVQMGKPPTMYQAAAAEMANQEPFTATEDFTTQPNVQPPTGANFFGDAGKESIRRAVGALENSRPSEAALVDSQKMQNEVDELARDSAVNLHGTRNLGLAVTKQKEGGIISSGPFADFTANIVGRLNNAIRIMFDPETASELQISNNAIANKEVFDKLTRTTAFQNASANQQNSMQSLMTSLEATANPRMTKQAATEIIAKQLVADQKNIDEQAYLRNYRDYALSLNYGPNAYMAQQADAAFRQDRPDANYIRDQKLITDMMIRRPDLYQKFVSGELSKKEIDESFAKKFGVNNMGRYFVGGY